MRELVERFDYPGLLERIDAGGREMSGDATRKDTASVLMIDDNPVNLQVLTSMLKQSGWRPRPVTSGRLGLQAARNEAPDLVLLDVNMPDMDGYEVCEQLKADPRLADIPVIFVSALGETVDKVRGFQVGGVDYITKPFQLDEVKARVTAHLELRRQRRELQASYEKLRESERLRDSLVHMIVHDLRSPLGAITAYLDLIAAEAKNQLGAEAQEDIANAQRATRSMIRMVNGILDVSKMEAQMMKLDLRSAISRRCCGKASRISDRWWGTAIAIFVLACLALATIFLWRS